MTLGEWIARSIDLSGFSQIEISQQLKIHQQSISDMVRGIVKNPKIEVLIKLAEICKVDIKWLITGKGEMIKSEPVFVQKNMKVVIMFDS